MTRNIPGVKERGWAVAQSREPPLSIPFPILFPILLSLVSEFHPQYSGTSSRHRALLKLESWAVAMLADYH